MSSSKKIILTSKEGDEFEVEEVVALESRTIKSLIEDDRTVDFVIHLPDVTSKILAKVIEYCKKHIAEKDKDEASDNSLRDWDAEFVKLDRTTLSDLLKAADYLSIKGLFNLTFKAVAHMINE